MLLNSPEPYSLLSHTAGRFNISYSSLEVFGTYVETYSTLI